jgi:hypothetical protein
VAVGWDVTGGDVTGWDSAGWLPAGVEAVVGGGSVEDAGLSG